MPMIFFLCMWINVKHLVRDDDADDDGFLNLIKSI